MAADEKKEEAKTAAEGVEGGEPSTAVAAPTAEAAAEEAVSKGPEIKLTVKHGQQTHQVAMPEESLVKELMDVLQGVTNVHPRGQKLIFKGEACYPSAVWAPAELLALHKEGWRIKIAHADFEQPTWLMTVVTLPNGRSHRSSLSMEGSRQVGPVAVAMIPRACILMPAPSPLAYSGWFFLLLEVASSVYADLLQERY